MVVYQKGGLKTKCLLQARPSREPWNSEQRTGCGLEPRRAAFHTTRVGKLVWNMLMRTYRRFWRTFKSHFHNNCGFFCLHWWSSDLCFPGIAGPKVMPCGVWSSQAVNNDRTLGPGRMSWGLVQSAEHGPLASQFLQVSFMEMCHFYQEPGWVFTYLVQESEFWETLFSSPVIPVASFPQHVVASS